MTKWLLSIPTLTHTSENSKLKFGKAIDSIGYSMFTNLIVSYDAFSLLVKILEPSICVDYSKHRNGDPIPPEITVAIGIRFMTGLLQDVHSTSI